MTEHEARCLAESRSFGSSVVREGAEQPPELRDEDVVEFEGEPVRWGDLCSQDRKAYMQGGSYPY